MHLNIFNLCGLIKCLIFEKINLKSFELIIYIKASGVRNAFRYVDIGRIEGSNPKAILKYN